MRFKNTFYNWLTNRFILIIRNEENFAIRRTLSFNYAKVIVLAILLFCLFFITSFYLVTTILAQWFNPEYAQMETNRKVILLASKVDSLEIELDRKDKFIGIFKNLISGKNLQETSKELNFEKPKSGNFVELDKLSSEDSLLRAGFEKEAMESEVLLKRRPELEGLYFFEPAEGLITREFSEKEGNAAITIGSREGEAVKATLAGTIIHVETRLNGTKVVVSHSDGFISKYGFSGECFKKPGDRLEGGEVIGEIGKDKKLDLELWYENRPVNPEYFINF